VVWTPSKVEPAGRRAVLVPGDIANREHAPASPPSLLPLYLLRNSGGQTCFGTIFPYPATDDEFALTEQQAHKLAKSRLAAGLPGYIGKARLRGTST
jgi:hypothetical protein